MKTTLLSLNREHFNPHLASGVRQFVTQRSRKKEPWTTEPQRRDERRERHCQAHLLCVRRVAAVKSASGKVARAAILSSDTDSVQISAGQWALALCLLLAALVLLAPAARAATNDLTSAIQRGLFEEEANQNLGAAIQAYQSVASQFDKDRKLAATAIFRLGECYRKQGNTNDAATQYQRILRDFSDQPTLVTLSRQNLAALGTAPAIATENTAPATASEADEVKRIQALIKDSPDLINAPDQNGETPLQSAAAKGNPAVVKLLLDGRAAVDGLRQPGLTALHYAAANGHKAVVDLLLSKGAKADAQNWAGITPLHVAAQKGYEEVAKALLAAGASVDAKTTATDNRDFFIGGVRCLSSESNQTPLHMAAAAGYASLAELLLAKGADANAEDGAGRTPLHLAAKGGSTGLVKLLLAKGANVNAQDREGRTPLSYAAGAHSEAITQLLLAAHADPNAGQRAPPLAIAAAVGDMPTLKLLLANGADPNTNNAMGWPLFNAVQNKHADAVAELLRFKANPNLPENNGDPLTLRARFDAPTLKALLDGGADPNARPRGGTPLLLQAVSDRIQPAVELLLTHHADVNCTVQTGMTPLLGAIAVGGRPIAELLLKAGADVNARYNDNAGSHSGNTALYEAVEHQQPDLVELLLANKADPNARNNAGQTPLDLARGQARPTSPRPGMPQTPGSAGMVPPGPMGLPSSQPLNINTRPPGAPAATAQQEAKPEAMVDLLRRHGAVDDLPQLDRIMVQRRSTGYSRAAFTKGSHDWGQLTLLDLIGAQWGFLASSPQGGGDTAGYSLGAFFNTYRPLPFPDLARLRIRRPAPDLKSWNEQLVDLRPVLEAGDCSKDVHLEWGDVVEIPEADHPLNEQWPGFSRTELANLKKCLTRQVEIVINGQATNITLAPQISNVGEEKEAATATAAENPESVTARMHARQEPVIVAHTPFWLKPVLLESKLVLTSSDLSRVKVTRRDPASGQQREWVVDCSEASPAPDLWLRDGDKIEVPEKGEGSAVTAPAGGATPK
jgi:ankyrin repeat protein